MLDFIVVTLYVYIYIYICCIFILKPVVHVVSGERCVYSEKKTEQDNYY